MDFLHPQAQAGKIRIHTALSPANPIARLDANLIKQAVLNLLINALQAMPDGGDLIIRTHVARDQAIIDISDTGVGIPPENLKRIFDAYFTTKKGGTGLGLPTTRRLIEEHRGHITVTSEPGRGTNFRVELPMAPLSPEHAHQPAKGPLPVRIITAEEVFPGRGGAKGPPEPQVLIDTLVDSHPTLTREGVLAAMEYAAKVLRLDVVEPIEAP